MESELDDKTKVDRGLLNSWFLEVQRTKVDHRETVARMISTLCVQEEADKFHKRRDTTVDHEKQLRLAIHEIEQVIPRPIVPHLISQLTAVVTHRVAQSRRTRSSSIV